MKTSKSVTKAVWDKRILEQLDKEGVSRYFRSVIATAKDRGIPLKALAKKLGMSRRKMEKLAEGLESLEE